MQNLPDWRNVIIFNIYLFFCFIFWAKNTFLHYHHHPGEISLNFIKERSNWEAEVDKCENNHVTSLRSCCQKYLLGLFTSM